jgi:hypothetical protein
MMPAVAPGISAPRADEARPMRGVASVRQSRWPFSGDLTGVLRETPVAPVGRVGVGGAPNESALGWPSR